MPAEPAPEAAQGKKKKKNHKSQLKVVFDTNALYVTPTSIGSASDLLRQEIADLIADSKYPDLDITWYLPDVVRHERQYQMQTEALKLRSAINKIERLLGHNLALTDQNLIDHVETRIEQRKSQLGLQDLLLNHLKVDWPTLIRAAEYRTPPFQAGEKEKGFRDSLIAESFLQLLEISPKTPARCRVVLVSSDELLSQAIKARIANSPNASVLANIEELKGLINTIVSNVGEEFISQLKPKATKLFFVSAEEKDALYFKANVHDQITNRFSAELKQKPEGTTFRQNGKWLISRPNFLRKDGRSIFWTSRIEIEIEAGIATTEAKTTEVVQPLTLGGPVTWDFQPPLSNSIAAAPYTPSLTSKSFYLSNLLGEAPEQKRIVTHRGNDIFEVLWSAELTMAKELKKGAIQEVRHIELNCQTTP